MSTATKFENAPPLCLSGSQGKENLPRIVRIAKLGRDFAASFTLGESKLNTKIASKQLEHAWNLSSLLQPGVVTDLEDYGDDNRVNFDGSDFISTDLEVHIYPRLSTLRSNRSTYNFHQGLLNAAEVSALQLRKSPGVCNT